MECQNAVICKLYAKFASDIQSGAARVKEDFFCAEVVAGHHPIGKDAVLEAVELPAGVADLHARLLDVELALAIRPLRQSPKKGRASLPREGSENTPHELTFPKSKFRVVSLTLRRKIPYPLGTGRPPENFSGAGCRNRTPHG